jgi:uncharacterized membrane protein YkoI
MTKSKLAIIGVLTVVALAASAVYAGKNKSEDEIDAATLAKANATLYQAITAAEQHTQGKAVQAEIEDKNGKLVYEVEVMKGATPMDVKEVGLRILKCSAGVIDLRLGGQLQGK